MLIYPHMYPILFTLFGYQIQSFGIFLILSILGSLFILWRLSSLFELDQEKMLDLFFIITLISFIGSRLWFVAFHLPQFDSILKLILFMKYPGLSFWGALLTGMIALRLITPKLKLNFWQTADLIIVAVFFAISLTSFGCLFSGCQYGQVYDGYFAIHQFGLSGEQFPLQLLESGLFLLGFIYLWNAILRFHFNGKIVSVGLIILGIIKLVLEPLRGDGAIHNNYFPVGFTMSIGVLILGISTFYLQSKRSFMNDLKFLGSLFYNSQRRKLVISKSKRSWYNFFVQSQISSQKWRKNLQRQFRVKSNPTKF